MQDALRRMRDKRAEGDNGFTLIELLVVVVIIGVLIAIAIPLYLNYRKGAENKSAASDLRGGISTLEQCYSDSSSQYPASMVVVAGTSATPQAATCLTSGGGVINLSSGNNMGYFPTGTPVTSYILAATHTGNGTWYCYNSTVGGSVKTESGTMPTTAPTGC